MHCSVVKLEEEEAKGDVMSEESTTIPRHSALNVEITPQAYNEVRGRSGNRGDVCSSVA